MPKRHTTLLFLVTLFLNGIVMNASAQNPSITLHDALVATLEVQGQGIQKDADNDALREFVNKDDSGQNLSWLDGVPTVSMQYFHNQTENGSKEAELSLSLPMKSALKRQVERNLVSNSEAVKASAQQQLELFYSGMLRETIWAYQEHNANLKLSKQKYGLLTKLFNQVETMTKAKALPQYMLFMLRKEMNDLKVVELENAKNAQQYLNAYRQLTGLVSMPSSVSEELLTEPLYAINQHPDLRAIDASWQSQILSLKAQSKSTEAWSVSLKARRVESPGFNENQLGIGLDIPISIGNETSLIQQNEFLQAKLKLDVERDKIASDLLTRLRTQQAEYEFLLEKQKLLEANKPTLIALEKAINELLEANTASADSRAMHIRTLIDLIDAQAEAPLNALAIKRQISFIRQTSGIPL